MKRILYLTFYFEPDLSAGSFRNYSLAKNLAKQLKFRNVLIDVYTTLPNRYNTFQIEAPEFEEFENLRVHRISLPSHKGGMLDQAISFIKFYKTVIKLNKGTNASLVFASSGRLFTAFLGFKIARMNSIPLYLDIRDLFVDTMNDVLKSRILKFFLLPILKIIEKKTFNYASHINLVSEGFKDYFKIYSNSNFTFFTNGIDDEFLQTKFYEKNNNSHNEKKIIVYAGNIGEGQGLHKILPQAAKLLENKFDFLIFGDGGAKNLLHSEIDKLGVRNIKVYNPVTRTELNNIYLSADFLFLHLNDYPAFKKVLPSKLFEMATFNKPIVAGVSGFCANFLRQEVSNCFVFEPCNVQILVHYLLNFEDSILIDRTFFIKKFSRHKINNEMAFSISSYL